MSTLVTENDGGGNVGQRADTTNMIDAIRALATEAERAPYSDLIRQHYMGCCDESLVLSPVGQLNTDIHEALRRARKGGVK